MRLVTSDKWGVPPVPMFVTYFLLSGVGTRALAELLHRRLGSPAPAPPLLAGGGSPYRTRTRSRAGEGGSGQWFLPLLSVFFSRLSLARSVFALPCVSSAEGVTLGRGRALQIGKISGVRGETCVALGPGAAHARGRGKAGAVGGGPALGTR